MDPRGWLVSMEALGVNGFLAFSNFLRVACIPWLMAPFLCHQSQELYIFSPLQTSASILTSSPSDYDPLSLPLVGPF